jgi:hypothetical protein
MIEEGRMELTIHEKGKGVGLIKCEERYFRTKGEKMVYKGSGGFLRGTRFRKTSA